MDKLIKYIEMRIKKYGHCKGDQAILSNYYMFGDKTVRISDHIKYGQDSVKTFDYCFVIQPNDTYIFTQRPTEENKCRMYVKIITLNDAKKFIKNLHDFTIAHEQMSEIYSPEGWNKTSGESNHTLSWDEFYNDYLSDKDNNYILKIVDQIELIYTGKFSKGSVTNKLVYIPEMFERLSITQYDTLISKIKKINKK